MGRINKLKFKLVASALLGKYNGWSPAQLERFTGDVHNDRRQVLEKYTKKQEVLLASDISRQLNVLSRIDEKWKSKQISLDLLFLINGFARGISKDEPDLRQVDYVPDFGGKVLTPSSEIEDELIRLAKLLARINKAEEEMPISHARLMAELFFEIVRIHPFSDGNGRTARFAVELLARKWGYEYIIIPKYRNDDEWRNALDLATTGDLSEIAEYILERLIKVDTTENGDAKV